MKTNVYGTFYCCRAVGRLMVGQGRGKVINLSSTDAFVGVPEGLAYCVSKGAVSQLTRALAVEWIRHGVYVNAIGPCDFMTPMTESYIETPGFRKWLERLVPIGRAGNPGEIVGTAVFLASSASDMVVGHTLMVDGGRTIF